MTLSSSSHPDTSEQLAFMIASIPTLMDRVPSKKARKALENTLKQLHIALTAVQTLQASAPPEIVAGTKDAMDQTLAIHQLTTEGSLARQRYTKICYVIRLRKPYEKHRQKLRDCLKHRGATSWEKWGDEISFIAEGQHCVNEVEAYLRRSGYSHCDTLSVAYAS